MPAVNMFSNDDKKSNVEGRSAWCGSDAAYNSTVNDAARVGDALTDGSDQNTALGFPMSRRTFLSLTAVVGSLTFLGQYLFGHHVINAYADENSNIHFTVYVLSYDEVPVMAFDMTDPANPRVIQGFNVEATAQVMKTPEGGGEKKLTSVTVKSERPTDEAGFTTVKIRNLTDEYEEKLCSYSCYAQIMATKNGHQLFETGQTLLTSGVHADEKGVYANTLVIPSLPDTGAPYLSKLTFDGLDAQRTSQKAYIVSTNDYTHTIDVMIRNAGNTTFDVILLANDKEIARTTTTKAEGGAAKAQFAGAWLDGKHGVSEGTKLSVAWVEQGKKSGNATALNITFEQATMLYEEGYKEGLSLSAGLALDQTSAFEDSGPYSTVFPGPESGSTSWLNKKGTVILGLLPLPVEVICLPDGTVVVTATLAGLFFVKRRDGVDKLKEPGQLWKPVAPKDVWRVSCSEWNRFATHCTDLYDSSRGNWGTFGAAFAHAKPISTFDISLDILLQGVGKTERKTNSSNSGLFGDTTTKIDFSIGSMGKLAFEWAIPFTVVFVPCFVGVDFTASILVKLIFGMAVDKIDGKLQSPKWSATSVEGLPASEYTLNFEAGLSAGVGAKNLISLGFRGYGTCTFFLSTEKKEESEARLLGVMAAAIDVVAQALCFRKDINLARTDPWKFLDKSWGDAQLPTSIMRDNPFGSPAPSSLDVSNQEYPVITFEKSDMVSEDSLKENCRLNIIARYVYNEQEQAWHWEEGSYVKGVWTAGAVDSLYAKPENPGTAPNIVDPYGTDGSSYNPVRGVKPSRQDLQRLCAFSDDRSCVESIFHYWNEGGSDTCGWHSIWFRIDDVKISCSSDEADSVLPFVYADASDADAPTCYYMAPNDGEHNQTPAEGSEFVYRTRLMWSVEISPATFFYDNIMRVNAIPDRVNTWDGDVDSCHLNTKAYLALCSFRRDPDKEKSWEEIFKTQFITLIVKDISEEIVSSNFLHDDNVIRWHPRICITQPKPNMHSNPGYTCSTYFYQQSKTGGSTTMGRGDYIQSEQSTISTSISEVAVPSRIAGMLEQGNFFVNSCECCNDTGLNDPRSADDLQQRFIGWVKPKTSGDDTALAVFWHEGHPEKALVIENVSSITKRPNALGNYSLSFLFSRDQTDAGEKDIFMVSFDLASRSIQGPNKVATSTTTTFFAPLDDYLYSVRLMDGNALVPQGFGEEDSVALSGVTGPFTSPQGAGEYGEGPLGGEVEQYQILRATWLQNYGCYSHFYPLCMVDHPIDGLTLIRASFGYGGSEVFIQKTIMSAKYEISNMYGIHNPHVVGIQLEGVKPFTHFCLPGDSCAIDIKVSNTGNEPLKSFSFKVTAQSSEDSAQNGDFEASAQVTELAKAKLESPDDTIQEVDDAGKPTGNWITKQKSQIIPGTLMPGVTRTYRASFIMPEGISGQVNFAVTVSVDVNDAGYGSDNTGEVELEDAVNIPADYPYTADDLADAIILNDPRSKDLALGVSSIQAGVDLSDYSAGSTVTWKEGDDSESAIPSTGDNNAGAFLGLGATAVVGAAAAGVAWYEKRRAENETEE